MSVGASKRIVSVSPASSDGDELSASAASKKAIRGARRRPRSPPSRRCEASVPRVPIERPLVEATWIEGAAIATAVSYSTAAAILFVFFLRDSGLPWHDVLILKRRDIDMWRRLAAEVLGERKPAQA